MSIITADKARMIVTDKALINETLLNIDKKIKKLAKAGMWDCGITVYARIANKLAERLEMYGYKVKTDTKADISTMIDVNAETQITISWKEPTQ
jgi:hypothetical protein